MIHSTSCPVHAGAASPRAQESGREIPVHFVGGAACGMFALVLEAQHIDLPSPSVQGRMHLYRFSGRMLPTDPPCRVFVHAGIVDRRP